MIKEVGLYGSTYKDGPERFEAGTPNIAGALGLAAAVDYLKQAGMDTLVAHERQLMEYALAQLQEIPQITLFGQRDPAHRVGAIAFNLGDIHAHDVSTVLDERGIAVRAGHHCAQPLMGRFNAASMCRASFALYNTKKDVDALVTALREAIAVFRL